MEWEDPEDFLDLYAQKTGKLLKKGEPDVATVAKMMLNDWIRGKIPFFVPPPDDGYVSEEEEENGDSEAAPTVPTRYVSTFLTELTTI